jgi:predicted methyltransferase
MPKLTPGLKSRKFISVLLLAAGALGSAAAAAEMNSKTRSMVEAAIAGEHRSAENRARDQYRLPLETLDFLGLDAGMTVVEIWPGGGWYSEILAPVLQEEGRFYAAQFDLNGPFGYQRRGLGAFLSKAGAAPDIYRDMVITEFELPYKIDIAPRGSVDMILTFRNVHNLVMEHNGGGRYVDLAFQVMFDTLKPGGILGVVDHEWDDADIEDPLAANGYISRARTIAFAEKAGFELAAESEILHNPRDTKDHPAGVWTLPPSFANGDEDRPKYEAIGESDRFLLKFVKPAG